MKCKRHQWNVISYSNGARTYSLTERCEVCRKSRKVNPKNGQTERR